MRRLTSRRWRQPRRSAEDTKSQGKQITFWEISNAVSQIIVAIFALAAFITGLSTYYEAKKSTAEARRQANAAEASNRAWLYLKKVTGANLHYEYDREYIDVAFQVDNIGNIPAEKAHIEAKLLSWPLTVGEEQDRLMEACAKYRNKDADYGNTILPHEPTTIQANDDAKAEYLAQARIATSDKMHVLVELAVCLLYKSGTDESTKLTAKMFFIDVDGSRGIVLRKDIGSARLTLPDAIPVYSFSD